MTARCLAVPAAAALPTLAEAVRAAKGDRPLEHVTLIVPTNAVGVTARRWLGANGGVAAIDLVTPQRLAERLAGAALARHGRRPVSTPLIDIAVRAELEIDAGVFAPVARHPSTVTSLRDLHRELRLGGDHALDRLTASSSRGDAVAQVSGRVAERIGTDWFDEADLLRLASQRVRDGVELFDRAVLFIPTPTVGLATDLLAAIAGRIDLQVIVEHTGVEPVDAEMAGFVRMLGAESVEVGAAPAEDAPAVSIVSTTDADEEVRSAVRRLVDAAREGVPFARMALVWPTDQPYARLAEHHLDTAGVPWNGRPGTLVTERLVPRFLLDLLEIDRRGLRRNELFDFLADVPVHGPSGRVSVARWERLARTAGVTRDDHWAPRLASLAASLRSRDEPREADADAADELAEFVADLRRDLGSPRRRRTWLEWVEWCERQVELRLGRSMLDQLDEAERLASDHTNRVLDRLRHLDAISDPVDRIAFRDAFAAEFEGAPGRLGRLGNGVTIGSLGGTAGLDADLTIVLGAADGWLPPPPLTDPLLSEADRRSAGLASTDARVHRLHRSFVGHLTTSRRVVISVPRGDLRSTSERLPSRWIATHAAGAPQHDVKSHHAGLIETEFPSHDHEHRLRGRAVAASAGPEQLGVDCAGDVAAERALALREARRDDLITVYDGDLSSLRIDHFERPVSPSRLESWMSCPHGYFMRYLLGVYPLDEPDDELGLSPLERGNAVHETLDRFQQRVINGELPQPGPTGWAAEHVTALIDLFEQVADEFERTGRTGRAAHWHLDRRSVRNDLLNWLVRDGDTMVGRGAEVFRSELRFGYDEPVNLPMTGGRELAVAGFVDRVDRRRSGDLVVTDHKSGKSDRFKNISADDPTEGATKFQLPVYASAALAAIGERPGTTDVEVLAEYGFFDRGRYERHGYTFDADVWHQVASDVEHVVSGIESGLYPAVAGPPGFDFFIDCHYCQPDGLGVHERYAEWSAKRGDARVHPWFPPEDDDAS